MFNNYNTKMSIVPKSLEIVGIHGILLCTVSTKMPNKHVPGNCLQEYNNYSGSKTLAK